MVSGATTDFSSLPFFPGGFGSMTYDGTNVLFLGGGSPCKEAKLVTRLAHSYSVAWPQLLMLLNFQCPT